MKIKIYRATILSVVLCGCATWSLTLRDEHRLRVFKNRVLRKSFGHKRDKDTEEWRRLHNEEVLDLYSSPNIFQVIKSSRMRWAGYVVRRVERSGTYRVLVGTPKGKRPIGRPRHRWEDNIKIDLQEMVWGMDWIDLTETRGRWQLL
jgi:hypothetical protein